MDNYKQIQLINVKVKNHLLHNVTQYYEPSTTNNVIAYESLLHAQYCEWQQLCSAQVLSKLN